MSLLLYLLKEHRGKLIVASVFLAMGIWINVATFRLHRAKARVAELEAAMTALSQQQRVALAEARARIARIDADTARKLDQVAATLPQGDDPAALLAWLKEIKK